ncbi:DNA-directed RNA polymerase subunit A' [Candidatus Woesearchaeota archaeon]|nr:DNA-directed RNA polymerase subunit A' [Candidatus Woesearchaeota archaeon]
MEIVPDNYVSSIHFGVLNPQLIKKMAVAKIVTPELYDREGYPVDGGLMDVRLGVIDPGLTCKTCGGRIKECPGHFGYIELAKPVLHIKFVPIIHDLLRTTCRVCGRILLPKDKIKKYTAMLDKVTQDLGLMARREKIREIIATTKSGTAKKCPYCGSEQLPIKLEKPSTFIEGDKRLNPVEIRARLEKIPDEDLEVLGINPKAFRPEWAVLTVLPVPPVTVRPSITLESGERSEDDLTHKLGDIVRINQRLFENINAGAPEIILEDLWDLLQYHVTTYFDNEIPQIPPARHRSGQPLKTLTSRIKSKEGRIRLNLLGKRTNFSARTVISPDPKLKINEVGVPEDFAKILTIPERVTEWNIEYLKEFVKRGPTKYPGANYVVRPDGKRKQITEETMEQLLEEIQPGYVVERHLIDGDLALFNRQPSLHRLSMMAHRVKVLPGNTLRLHPAVCTPYNADFDGDEMNLHIPQTEEAIAEAHVLMEVQTQLISPRYGLTIIGATQDPVTGNYLLTRYLTLPRSEAVQLLAAIGFEDFSRLPNKEVITGKEIFSCLLPKDFNFKAKSRLAKEDPNHPDAEVEIVNGKLVKGVMDSENIGSGKGLMFRTLHKRYGSSFMIDFLGKVYNLGVEVLTRYGFTIFLSDLDLNQEAKQKVEQVLQEAKQKVDELIKSYEDGSLKQLPGRTLSETLEVKILEVLNKARNTAGELVYQTVSENLPTVVMVKSGGRGNIINIAQMSAIVGQQALRGFRISKGYKHRTLSCFKKHDLRPAARGFIENSFAKGLKPAEYFFMSMTGRDSLMDTALRTPKSGYLYRRLSSALQDVKVEYDFTVRDGNHRIVQFLFGEDGVAVSKSEAGRVDVERVKEILAD